MDAIQAFKQLYQVIGKNVIELAENDVNVVTEVLRIKNQCPELAALSDAEWYAFMRGWTMGICLDQHS